jgi:hypothetical protein
VRCLRLGADTPAPESICPVGAIVVITLGSNQGEQDRGDEKHGPDEQDKTGSPNLTHGLASYAISKRSVLICRKGTPTATSASSMASIMTSEPQMRYS